MGMKKTEILIVDDDPEIRKIVGTHLKDEGFTVHMAANAMESLESFEKKTPDLILLDMILPDAGGLDLMTTFRRQTKAPIIVISGKTETTDRIVGLEMGADDYLTKPFHLRELSARIRSVLRRVEASAIKRGLNESTPDKSAEIIHFGEWIMNCGKYEVSNDFGNSVPLTSGEFQLLHALVNSPNRVLKREQLFEMTRGEDYDVYDRTIDIQIGRLRRKLNDNPHAPSLIKTVRGVGYMFIGDVKKRAEHQQAVS